MLWARYLLRDHSVDELKEWAQRLKWFRFCRAFGGHAHDGDQLVLAIRSSDEAELNGLWKAVGGAQQSPTSADIRGVRLSVTRLKDRTLLSLSGAEGDPFQVTDKDVANAEVVEQALMLTRASVLDPPLDDRHCVAPKFYPEFWQT
jgi:hypothetical protein